MPHSVIYPSHWRTIVEDRNTLGCTFLEQHVPWWISSYNTHNYKRSATRGGRRIFFRVSVRGRGKEVHVFFLVGFGEGEPISLSANKYFSKGGSSILALGFAFAFNG